jgi:hypothetical protein
MQLCHKPEHSSLQFCNRPLDSLRGTVPGLLSCLRRQVRIPPGHGLAIVARYGLDFIARPVTVCQERCMLMSQGPAVVLKVITWGYLLCRK